MSDVRCPLGHPPLSRPRSMKDAWAEIATAKLPRAFLRGEEVEGAKCFSCSGDRGCRRIAPIAAWVSLCTGGDAWTPNRPLIVDG
eukprot:8571775-Pyramimonas_sp.AAC.1